MPRPCQANSIQSDAHPLGSEAFWNPTDGPSWLTTETAPAQWYGWAEHFVMLAWGAVKFKCSPGAIFGETCTLGEMRRLEREMLASALSARGLKLVEWAEGEAQNQYSKPLLFPPAWVDENYMLHQHSTSYYEACRNGPSIKIAWDQ